MKKILFILPFLFCLSCTSAPVIRADTSNLDALIQEAEKRGDAPAVKKLTVEKKEKIALAENLTRAEKESKTNAKDAGKWTGFLFAFGAICLLFVAGVIIKIVIF